VNDGGQRVLRRTDTNGVIGAYSSTDLATYMTNKSSGPFYETGTLQTFEHAACHDYVACDVTAAYDSPGFTTSGNMAKVKEVTRQLVFVRPEIVLVFDRVEALDPSYEKRFLLHASGTGVMPVVANGLFTIDNNGGRLIGKTLLPAGASSELVPNFTVAGTAFPPDLTNLPNEPEVGGNRIEVKPAKPAARDYFLNVLDATDPSTTTLDAELTDAPDTATATIHDGANTYVVSFAKTGPPGGHLKVSGAMSCDQDLGANATTGSGGSGGASGTGGAGAESSGSGTGGASGGPMAKGGCSCRTAGAEGDVAAGPALLGLLALARRRRKPTRRA
jgi:MYXO-CTERM domain-containing protein